MVYIPKGKSEKTDLDKLLSARRFYKLVLKDFIYIHNYKVNSHKYLLTFWRKIEVNAVCYEIECGRHFSLLEHVRHYVSSYGEEN